jgi:hypothetical protein
MRRAQAHSVMQPIACARSPAGVRELKRLPYREQAEKLQRRYQPTARVTVYYDRTDPRQAVLERGIHGTTWLALFIGVLSVIGLGWDLISG